MNNHAYRVALKASSRATIRPVTKSYSPVVERVYRQQMRQMEEILGLSPRKKPEGIVGQVLGCIGSLLGYAAGATVLFYVLSRI